MQNELAVLYSNNLINKKKKQLYIFLCFCRFTSFVIPVSIYVKLYLRKKCKYKIKQLRLYIN